MKQQESRFNLRDTSECISAEGSLAVSMVLAQGHEMRQKSNGTCKADGQTRPRIQSWKESWVPLGHGEYGRLMTTEETKV